MSSVPRNERQPRRNGRWIALGAGVLVALLALPGLSAVPPPLGHTLPSALNAPTACAAGMWPQQAAYDPVNHFLYVPIDALHGPNITVLSPSCKIIAAIALAANASPFAAAFDPQNDYVYVTDSGLGQVYVVSGTGLIATIAGGWFSTPRGVTFDPGDGEMFVANWGVSNITGIQGTSVTGSVAVGLDPEAIAYDPFFDSLLVTNYGTNNVTIISSATFPYTSSHASVAVSGAWGIVYDPADELDYVGASGYHNLTIMGGTGIVVGTVATAGYPEELCYNEANFRVYVTDRGTSNVLELKGTTVVAKVHFAVGVYGLGVVYDEFNDRVYVSVDPSGSLEVL